MNSTIIQARDLTKVYRLYAKPYYRFLDMFGLLPNKPGLFSEHVAVDHINLEIKRGEKVAFIGRNGAGKSTLLKLITGVIEPTTGSVDVASRIHALLQIGTGFHPEFTGRENVYSYLAQLGVDGGEAHRKVEEIIEFAELEEYIDQPIKTYSTGMGVRLMFAASTAISPDILVLDEVLGVGDAYFSQKSFQQIKSLCENGGTTLLLVTHDLYSAMEVCNRFIWIERGAVLMDATAKEVVHRYEASIRDQQEARLRRNHLKSLEKNKESSSSSNTDQYIFGQIRCEGNVPIDHKFPIAALRFIHSTGELCSISPGIGAEGISMSLYLGADEHNWEDPDSNYGKPARAFTPCGSIYHRAPFVIASELIAKTLKDNSIQAEIEYKDTAAIPCILELFHNDGLTRSWASIKNSGSGQWKKELLHLKQGTELETAPLRKVRYGTQKFAISDVDFIKNGENSSHVFNVGDQVTIRLTYEIHDRTFRQHPVIQLNFLKDGTTRSHRFTLENQLFAYQDNSKGILEVIASPLLLGPGDYLVNIVVMSEGGYLSTAQKKFFTANDLLLDHHSRAYEIKVLPTDNILVNDIVFLHKATWKKDGHIIYDGIYPLPAQQNPPEDN